MWRACGALRARRAGARACGGGGDVPYAQGQAPEPRTREYFYYVDHQGQLFLDDSKMKNFTTCFKDPQFLVTFFSRLRPNRSGRYEASFPFLSPCGRERNFLRCEDRPVVFTHLLASGPGPPRLSYCGGGDALAVPFEPARLLPLAANGRLYHPAPERAGGVGLVRSALAFELSACFEYPPGAAAPSHVRWQGRRLALTMDLAPRLPAAPP